VEFIWSGVDDTTQTGDLQFSYQLDDQVWSLWSTAMTVSYDSLANGNHTFSVRSQDQAGNVDSVPASVNFTIRINSFIVTAPKAGGGPQIRVFDASGRLVSQFFAFDSGFRGGVSVAMGDLGGDGTDEVIVGSGPGRVPEVRIFRRDGTFINSFYAYQTTFRGGVNVTAGDFDGNGTEEIATAPMSAGGPNIRVFGYRSGSFVPVLGSFMAYHPNFRGGVSVAAADNEGDGQDEIVTAPMINGGPQIRIFSLHGTFVPVGPGFMAYSPSFRGGVTLTSGRLNQDFKDEIITGIFSRGGPQIRVFGKNRQGVIGPLNPGFFSFTPSFRGGISVAAADTDLDGIDEVIVAVGGDSQPLVRIFSQDGKRITASFFAFARTFLRGINVAGGE
jgi:hypothetical protein